MTWMSRVQNAFTTKQAPESQGTSGVVAPIPERYPWRDLRLRDNLAAYDRNPLIRACIDVLASTVIDAPLIAVNSAGEPAEFSRLSERLMMPDGRRSTAEWLKQAIIHYYTCGNVYALRTRPSEMAMVTGWELLRPDRVQVLADRRTGELVGYKYEIEEDGFRRDYPASTVAHWRAPSGRQDRYGVGVVTTLREIVDTDTLLTALTRAYIDNAGVPAGILNLLDEKLGEITDKRKLEILAGFIAGIRGRRAGNTAVLEGNVKYERISALDNPEITPVRDIVEQRVIGLFGLDPRRVSAGVGLRTTSGTADYNTGQRAFWEGTARPLYRGLEGWLRVLADPDYTDMPHFDLSKVAALQPDKEAQARWASAVMLRGGMLIDEFRALFGMPPLPDGAGQVRTVLKAVAEVGADEKLTDAVIVPEEPQPMMRARVEPQRMLAKQATGHLPADLVGDLTDAELDDLLPPVRKAMNQIARTALAGLGRGALPEASLISATADDVLIDAFRPGYESTYSRAWNGVNSIGSLGDIPYDESYARAASTAREPIWRGIIETTRKAVDAEVAKGVDKGYTPRQILNGVKKDNYRGAKSVMKESYTDRSRVIARTEAATARNTGAAARYEAGGITHVEIFDGVDYDEECASANGQIWTLAEYQANPIAHPNCTRYAVPILPEEGGP